VEGFGEQMELMTQEEAKNFPGMSQTSDEDISRIDKIIDAIASGEIALYNRTTHELIEIAKKCNCAMCVLNCKE
jgi:hypothetical protein